MAVWQGIMLMVILLSFFLGALAENTLFRKEVSQKSELNIEERDFSFPSDIYPELLIVVDLNLRRKIGGTEEDVRVYIRQLFGNVQAVYNTITQPKFHFRLADIYICQTTDDCSYITKNTIGSLLHVDNEDFLKELAKWAQGMKGRLAGYDLLMTLTSLEMHRTVNPDGTAPRGTGLAGKTYLGGVCSTNNVGIATDNGGFEGIKVISHEMAHLFGAVHDGSSGGGEACDPREGYIMGGSSKPANLFRPSPCTIKSIAKHLLSSQRDCLRIDRPGRYQLDHTLPGSFKSTDDQCRQRYGPQSKNCPFFGDIKSKVCQSHWCYYPITGTCRASGSAFSGTPCDEKNPEMHCYMSYGCVHKSFQAPSVDADLSDIVTPTSKVGATTKRTPVIRRTTTAADGSCRDAHRTHLKITTGGRMTNCTENYRLYPKTFCSTGWVREKCCATAKDNCKNGLDVFG